MMVRLRTVPVQTQVGHHLAVLAMVPHLLRLRVFVKLMTDDCADQMKLTMKFAVVQAVHMTARLLG